MRLPGVPLALLCCAAFHYTAFAAQDPPAANNAAPAPEIAQHDAPATFISRSNLVEVPVVVRDKQGHPVGNLTKDDFFLFDKGKPQYIARFTVERAGKPYIQATGAVQVSTDPAAQPTVSPFDNPAPAAPPVPERFISYIIDDVHLSAGDLAYLRKATLDHIDKSLDPVTRVAIVTTSGVGVLDFTDDTDRIHEALNHIVPYTQMPTSSGDCPKVSLYMADLIINKGDLQAQAIATADATACAGKVSSTSTQSINGMVQSAAISALAIGEDQTRKVLEALVNVSNRMSAMPGSRMIVLMSPGFILPGDDLRISINALYENAVKNNVVINSLDARGLYTIIPGGDASTRTVSTSNLTQRNNYDTAAALAQEDILEELADGTGGSFFYHDNGLEQGLDQLTKQPETVYLLGFSPSDLKYDGSFHNLKVTLKNPLPGKMQARHGYYAPKRANDPNEAAKEDIREAVFSRDELQDIPVDLRLQFFKSSPTNARLSVISHIDLKSLHFRKDQDRSKDTLVVVAGLFDRNGNFVSGTQRTLDMALRDQTLNVLSTNGINVPANFEVTPGNYTIRVVVRDAEGQMMAARNGAVQIP